MKQLIFRFLMLLCLVPFLAACNKDDDKQKNEVIPFDVSGIVPDTTDNGLIIYDLSLGSGESVGPGYLVEVHSSVFLDGEVISSTVWYDQPIYFQPFRMGVIRGLEEGVLGMKAGGKRRLIIPPALAYGNTNSSDYQNDTLIYDVELLQTDIDQEVISETDNLDSYVATHYPDSTPLISGMYYMVLQKGTGPKAAYGQTAKAHYRLFNLAGTEVSNSYTGAPLQFTIGTKTLSSGSELIPGWVEATSLMSQGEKARFIMPSYLAYGSKQVTESLPPYSTLIYEIELVDLSY